MLIHIFMTKKQHEIEFFDWKKYSLKVAYTLVIPSLISEMNILFIFIRFVIGNLFIHI